VNGKPDSITHKGKERHFCPDRCLLEHLMEHQFHDVITDAVEKRVQQELRALHKNVCPACKWRLAKDFDLMEPEPCPSCGYAEESA
jgi:hypothetical protein